MTNTDAKGVKGRTMREGVDGLIMALNRKVDLLTRNVAKAA